MQAAFLFLINFVDSGSIFLYDKYGIRISLYRDKQTV